MPPREWLLRVRDILDAAAKIEDYLQGMSFDDFSADAKTVDAVARNVITIGEAAANVPAEVQALHPSIPWADMRDTRNVLVHGYFGLRVAILWQTAVSDLPPLVPLLEAMLRDSTE